MSENPMDDYWPNSEGREAEQMRATNYPDVVRVALHFEKMMGNPMTDDQIVGHIMRALGGKSNPIMLREEIKNSGARNYFRLIPQKLLYSVVSYAYKKHIERGDTT